MFSIERRVSLVFCRDLSYLVVPLRALIVRELAVSRNFSHFGVLNLFLELRVPIIVD